MIINLGKKQSEFQDNISYLDESVLEANQEINKKDSEVATL